MKKEIPILYSTPMVQAKLAGRKTMTRRIIKPKDQPYLKFENSIIDFTEGIGWVVKHQIGSNPERFEITQKFKCPYGQPGDLHWVRENFSYLDRGTAEGGYRGIIKFAADGYEIDFPSYPKAPKSMPSIHMPKAAARIWEEVVSERVERLQDISEEDAIAEGIEQDNPAPLVHRWKSYVGGEPFKSPINSYHSLWQSINGTGSWEANPWVWVIETKTLSTTGKPLFKNIKSIDAEAV